MHRALAWKVALAATLTAPLTLADGASISLAFEQYEQEQDIDLVVKGSPGDLAILFVAGDAEDTDIPGFGLFGLDPTADLAQLNLGPIPDTGELVATCDVPCGSPILEAPCFVQVVTISPLTGETCLTGVLDISGAAADCGLCPANPTPDAVLTDSTRDFGLRLAGLGALEDFVFTGGGEFAEYGDGTGRLTGIVAARDDADCRFWVDLAFEGRINPLDANHPPAGSPVLSLFPAAYEAGGGPVDPDGWHYYGLYGGTAWGIGGCFEGARIDLFAGTSAAQIGRGAGGLNDDFGVYAPLGWSLVDQPTSGGTLGASGEGDLTSDVRDCPVGDDGPVCVTRSIGDGDQFCTGGEHAVWFQGLGEDWRFVGGTGDFYEAPDGTATLSGEIFNVDKPTQRFCLDVLFTGLVEPGDANYPPGDSPKLGLCDELYKENGGPIDTDTYRYYTDVNGVLVGKGDLDCAVLSIELFGFAMQIGDGGSVKNTNFGLSSWFQIDVLEQPCDGDPITATNGDFNMDIVPCPTVVAQSIDPVSHWDFDDQVGSVVVDRQGPMDLTMVDGSGDLEWVVDGYGRGLEFVYDAAGTGPSACVRVDSAAETTWFRESVEATGAFTLQVALILHEDGHDEARIASFASGLANAECNFGLVAGITGAGQIDSGARLATYGGAHAGKVLVDPSQAIGGPFCVLAMSYDAFEDGVLRLSVDGTEIGAWDVGGDLSNWEDRMFLLGNEATEDRPFDGVIYDVKLWNRALEREELIDEAIELHAGA